MGLGFESQGLVGNLCALMLLALVRLVSVQPVRAEKLVDHRPRKELRMGRLTQFGDVYMQCVLETIWAGGAGVLAAHWHS